MSAADANVRAVAAEVVDAVVSGGQSLDAAILKNEARVAPGDRSLLRMLCYGSLRYHWRLQAWLDQLIAKPIRKRDRVINALLAIGLYQIVEMRIPDHAVVSETVEATRALGRPKLAGFVNACLRRFTRDNIVSVGPADAMSTWNHPAWLIQRTKDDWPDDWQAILTANNERAPMWLRANASRNSAMQYCERLADAGIGAEPLAGIPDAVRLAEPKAVDDLPGFAVGDASVQDAAAQVAARWLLQQLPEGKHAKRVLDACAAPGGKSGHLLEIGGDELSLLAMDSDESRLDSIADNLTRIGRDATIIAADASKPKEWWDGEPFDGILLDAPCSASGVIRRHPDIKLLRRESDLASLAARQKALLEALWPLLAPGGCLLYATCSVIAAENDEVIKHFLTGHGDAFENDVLPNNNIRDLMRKKACGYQILPGSGGLDGFYYAALQKKKVS
ncbi:MAG: 16S rRNA (cytosine(967)-C(5))-methyltransferase RsmB [Woeseiaceae bacterium]|nr:16S rRNA (cytosine(967)-C(5))-methyltransferase RsmB [Woeseiaceae bacterium]